MAVQNSFFWDGEQEYGEEELRQVFRSGIRSGIGVSDAGVLDFSATTDGATVTVSPGVAMVDGEWFYKSTTQVLTPDKIVNFPRIDRLVVYSDFANKVTGIKIKQGAEAASPVPPTLQRDATMYELSLYQIKVPDGSITITDERADTSVCGAIRMRDCSEFDNYVKKTKTLWDAWFAQQQGTGWRKIAVQTSTPENPTAGMIWFCVENATAGDSDKIVGTKILEYSNLGEWEALYSINSTDQVYTTLSDNSVKPLSKIVSPDVIGVQMKNDLVAQNCIYYHPIPFGTEQNGFCQWSSYATLQSNGYIKIEKTGVYQLSAQMYISDCAAKAGNWHLSIWVDGAMRIENCSTNSGSNDFGLSCCGLAYLAKGDMVSMFIKIDSGGTWRVDAGRTALQIVPKSLD